MTEDSPGIPAKAAAPPPDRGRLNWHAPKLMVEKVTYVTETKAGGSGADVNPNVSRTS